MTHTLCTQLKPSLSVRTRALRSKFKRNTRCASIRKSIDGRLRLLINGRRNICCTDTLVNERNQSQFIFNELSSGSSINSTQTPSIASNADVSVSSSASSSCASNQMCVCKWENCDVGEIERSQLANHIQQAHVLPQLSNRRKYFCCLWHGCRVFRRPSVSSVWLEQHVLHHTDFKGKPFRCIFDSCNMRFSTSVLLERHVERVHIHDSFLRQLNGQNTTEVVSSNLCDIQEIRTDGFKKILFSPLKKQNKKKKKPKTYRVRRIDFYDTRSQLVIQNRLRVSQLLSKQFLNMPDSLGSTFNNLHGLPNKLLPKPILRSSSNRDQLSSMKFQSDTAELENLSDTNDRILLLLSIPFTFVGQRLSEDNHHEYLVRWSSDFGKRELPPTWILEKELLIAESVERYFWDNSSNELAM